MSLDQLDRELLGEDEDSDLSDSRSIATDDAFPEFSDLSTVAVGTEETEVAAPPEVTPEQAAQINARPRRALRRAGIPAQNSTMTGGSLPVSQPPPIPQQLPLPLTNSGQSPRSAAPESTAELPKDKGKGKEVASAYGRNLTTEEDEGVRRLTEAQLRHLKERFLPGHRYELLLELQANYDAELAAETSRVEEDARRRVAEFIAAQGDNSRLAQAEAVVSAQSLLQLQQQLSDRNQHVIRLQNELGAVQRDRDQALHAIVLERAMREQASGPSQSEQWANQQLEEIREELSREKVTNDNLRQSLANCQAGQENQPPADDCTARLRDLEARLKQEHAKALKAQAERMLAEGRKASEDWAAKEKAWWWEQAGAFRAEKDGEVARATARAEEEKRVAGKAIADLEEEKRRAEKAMADLKKELETRPASQEAGSKIQSLEGQRKELAEEKRALSDNLYRSRKDCEIFSARVRALETELRRERRKVERGGRKVEDGGRELRDLTRTVDSLREEKRTVEADRTALDKRVRSTTADFNAARADLSEEQTRTRRLVDALWESDRQLAESNGRVWEAAWEVDDRKKEAREMEDWLDGRLERWRGWEEGGVVEEAETGEKEMDSLLGVPEEAIEGPLRPQFPSWRTLLLLVCFLLVGFVVGLSASSAERLWFGGGDEMTWGVQLPGDGLGLLWEDPLGDLSRGMYGV